MKKLGIIGGVGWASTALYYQAINEGVARTLGGLHGAVLSIENLDFDPIAKLQHQGDWHAISLIAIDAAKRLERSGAEGLLIASNTMHTTYDDVAAAVSIPVLHISNATASALTADNKQRVTLLGTRTTMSGGFIRDRYEEQGIQFVSIDESWTREVDRIIYEELAAGRVVRESQRKLKTLITQLGKQKVQAIVLGCTELVLAVDVRANVVPVYDTTALHARMAVKWMLGEVEQARAAA